MRKQIAAMLKANFGLHGIKDNIQLADEIIYAIDQNQASLLREAKEALIGSKNLIELSSTHFVGGRSREFAMGILTSINDLLIKLEGVK